MFTVELLLKMNEKLLSSYFRKHLIGNEVDFIEQVPFRYERIDYVILNNSEIISLELKVSNVKSVLHQALQNLLFSNKSYVVLWYKYKSRINDEIIEVIEKYNIGFNIVKKIDIIEIYKPRNNNKYLNPNYYKSFKRKIQNLKNENLS